MDATTLKQRMCQRIDDVAEMLVATSHDIHAHPELMFEEHHAHELLTGILEREGIGVTRGAHGVDTAFDARVGSEGAEIAVCLEYDALPGVGHACGHNIIAAAGLGASLAAAALADEAGGRVRILGTPAEEGGGGKVYMAEDGAFDGVDAAMMIHPADVDLLQGDIIAAAHVDVAWEGRAAHAAAAPWKGANALDAAVLGYVNVAALRQHIEPSDRVHGIFLEGGRAPNIVPDRASMRWIVRSATMASLEPLQARVEACWEASAAATGCSCTHHVVHRPYADMVDNQVMARLYAANAASLGRPFPAGGPAGTLVGSTDMGNVSYLVPSIHPIIKVSPTGVPIHSHEFAAHAASPAGDDAVVLGAKLLATTLADLWTSPDAVAAARAEHAAEVAARAAG